MEGFVFVLVTLGQIHANEPFASEWFSQKACEDAKVELIQKFEGKLALAECVKRAKHG